MSDYLSPATRAVVEQMEAAAPTQQTPEFTRYAEGLFGASVCTSLSDEDATARMNLAPAGTTHGWHISDQETWPTGDPHPSPCHDNPDTHRHIHFEC